MTLSRFVTSVCLFVCLSVFPHDVLKIDAASITKLDIEIPTESLKPIYFGSNDERRQDTKTVPVWVFALLWVLASSRLQLWFC